MKQDSIYTQVFGQNMFEADVKKTSTIMGDRSLNHSNMPVIDLNDRTDFFEWIEKGHGIRVLDAQIDRTNLKVPHEYYMVNEVEQLCGYDFPQWDLDTPLITTKDNVVIDGHHAVIAGESMGVDENYQSFPCKVLDETFENVIEVIGRYPKVKSESQLFDWICDPSTAPTYGITMTKKRGRPVWKDKRKTYSQTDGHKGSFGVYESLMKPLELRFQELMK